jgi:hypothetical protein
MATETQRSSTVEESRRGNETRTERTEVTITRDNTPRKAFRLKQGRRHYQDGQLVAAGDVVQLTRDQARAFADKFDQLDESDFVAGEYRAYSPEDQRKARSSHQAENAPQGQAPQAAPVAVGGGPLGEALKDVTAIDPARQGQPTTELRRVIDSGGAPPAVVPEIPSLDEQRKSAAGVTEGTKTTGATATEPATTGRPAAATAAATGTGSQGATPMGKPVPGPAATTSAAETRTTEGVSGSGQPAGSTPAGSRPSESQ